MKTMLYSTIMLAVLSLPLHADERRGASKPHSHKQFAHEKREAAREHREQKSKEHATASDSNMRPEGDKFTDAEKVRHKKIKAAQNKIEQMTPGERKVFKVKMHKRWSSLSDEKKSTIKERVRHRYEKRLNRQEERNANATQGNQQP